MMYNTRNRSYLRDKTIFCNKVTLDVLLMNLLFEEKNNISFLRHLDFCVFVKSTGFKICDIIIGIPTHIMEVTLMFISLES